MFLDFLKVFFLKLNMTYETDRCFYIYKKRVAKVFKIEFLKTASENNLLILLDIITD